VERRWDLRGCYSHTRIEPRSSPTSPRGTLIAYDQLDTAADSLVEICEPVAFALNDPFWPVPSRPPARRQKRVWGRLLSGMRLHGPNNRHVTPRVRTMQGVTELDARDPVHDTEFAFNPMTYISLCAEKPSTATPSMRNRESSTL
jgi:hypothetical protein